jgi:hypothetical protein
MIDISKWEKTYNHAIDLCLACVSWHRHKKQPLKAIWLRSNYYDLLYNGMSILQQSNEDFQYELDGVPIYRGDKHQISKILCEFFEFEGKIEQFE